MKKWNKAFSELGSKSRNNAKTYLWDNLLSSSVFAGATFLYLFWRSIGMDLQQILLLQAIYAVVLALLEVPSGYIADVFGRRKTVIASSILQTVGGTCYLFAHGFGMCLVAELFWALADSMNSGADEAMIQDSLLEEGKGRYWEKVKIVGGCAFKCGSTFFALLVGALYFLFNESEAFAFSYRATFVIPIFFFTLRILVVANYQESNSKKERMKPSFGQFMGVFRYCFLENFKAGWIILASGGLLGFNIVAFWLYTPYFKICKLEEWTFPLVYAFLNLVAAGFEINSVKIRRRVGGSNMNLLIWFCLIVGLILISYITKTWSFLLLFFLQGARGLGTVFYSQKLSELAKSETRATTISISSMLGRLIYTMVLVVCGLQAKEEMILSLFFWLSIAAIVYGICLWCFKIKER